MRGRYGTSGALVAVLVLLTGCGGGSSSNQTDTFKSGYKTAIAQLKQTSSAIGSAINQAQNQTDGEVLVAFRALAGKWQTGLSQLETLKPPSKQAADFNTLTAAATRVETDLNAIVSAAATHSKTAAEQAGASIVTDIVAARSADATIRQSLGIK